MPQKIKGISSVLVIFGIISTSYILNQAGFFTKVNAHFDGREKIVNSPPGAEDITIDHKTGIAYLSATDRRNPDSDGGIFFFDTQKNEINILPLKMPKLGFDFRPHGISLFETPNGNQYLFVVNHEKSSNNILRFRLKNDSLIYEKKFNDPIITSPNDLKATGLNSFYVTNDHGKAVGFERKLGDFMLAKTGNLVYYKEGEAAIVSQNMAYANGVNLSPDNKYLYVTATTEKNLFVYENTGSLNQRKLLAQKYIGTGVDNIEVDPDGNLWIGSHPKMLKFLSHGKDSNSKSPSQVIKIVYLPETDYKFLQEDIYQNTGESLSGSSVAVTIVTDSSNAIFVGSVFEPKILKLTRDL